MKEFIGLDVGRKSCHLSVVDEQGREVVSRQVRTSRRALLEELGRHEPTRVLLETGGETWWLSRLIAEAGHEPWVCPSRQLRVIAESTLKCDRLDAQLLARLSRLSWMDDALVPAVYRRGEGSQRVRAMLGVRRALVKQRTACVNAARGLARVHGHGLPGVRPKTLPQHVARSKRVPENFKKLLAPLMDNVQQLSDAIEGMNDQVEQFGKKNAVIERLQTIDGIGPLTALAFVACIEDPSRFRRSRSVGCYLGLRPRLRASGATRHEGRITKTGDADLRHVLVQAAHALMNCQKDSELKEWGKKLEARVGRQKAVVAVARKLAVLMHRLWVSQETYQPRRQAQVP